VTKKSNHSDRGGHSLSGFLWNDDVGLFSEAGRTPDGGDSGGKKQDRGGGTLCIM
jgi:hypothetical protein